MCQRHAFYYTISMQSSADCGAREKGGRMILAWEARLMHPLFVIGVPDRCVLCASSHVIDVAMSAGDRLLRATEDEIDEVDVMLQFSSCFRLEL